MSINLLLKRFMYYFHVMAGLRKVEYIFSQRGTPQVYLDGHLYNKNAVRQTCIHWLCVVKSCNGRCTTVGDFVRNTTEHSHAPQDEQEYQRLKFLSNTRKRAREETTPMLQLYNNEIAKQIPGEVHQLPSFHSIRSALYRQRKKTIPVVPLTRGDVDLDGMWVETSDGRSFLLISDGDADKIIAFSTDEQLRALQSADTIYMDGTFSACPALWDQVYIIHARSGMTSYALLYALLPNRQADTYARLFAKIKEKVQERLNLTLDPAKIQTDFELAAIRAVEREFPNAEIKGCYFHFCQALWRKVQDLGIAVRYREEPLVQQWIRRAAGLALLPLNKVQDAWLETMEETPDVARAEEFNDYMVVNWVDYEARFTMSIWNHFETTGPRTNNNLEGFHNRLNRSLPHNHPNIYRFVEVIKKIETADRAKLRQIDFGAALPPRKRVYRDGEPNDQAKRTLTPGHKVCTAVLGRCRAPN